MSLEKYRMKWWGWGDEHISSQIGNRPGVLLYLQSKFSLKTFKPRSSLDFKNIVLKDSSLSKEILQDFINALGEDQCKTDKLERIIHSYGKSYKDLLRIRLGRIENPPDFVLYPKTDKDIQTIFQLCNKHKIALIPFAGGTSVTGGVESFKGNFKYSCALNMTRLNKFINIDIESQTAEVEAGMFGPDLENYLLRYGFTFGHFPQSFEFSTVGGWIATRSSGQNSLKYGGIEKLVQSIKLITPTGIIKTLDVPRMATGLDFNEIILGSEGRLGIILSAVLKITPVPEEKKYFMYLFPSFSTARSASKALVQQGIRPAMIRVSDEVETEGMFAMGKEPQPWWKSVLGWVVKKYLTLKKFNLKSVSNVVVGLEGSVLANRVQFQIIKSIFKSHGGFYMGVEPGRKWLRDRFFLPYFRDDFLDNDLLVDTLETATNWSDLELIYQAVRETVERELKTPDNNVLIFTHISHLYSSGASLYFSIIANQDKERALEQWQRMKDAINCVLKQHHVPISHHHGVGMDHISGHHWGAVEKQVFVSIVKRLDPFGILNPGKLNHEEE